MKMLNTGHFMNSVVMIDAGGQSLRTLPKDVQFHPVSDRPLHVDFLRIGEHTKVHVNVPVVFTDEDASPGIKRGAVLNIVVSTIWSSICRCGRDPRPDPDLARRPRCRRDDPYLEHHAAGRRRIRQRTTAT